MEAVFITASEYFAKRFAGSPYEETFQNYFSTYSTTTNLFTFVFILWIQNRVNETLYVYVCVLFSYSKK